MNGLWSGLARNIAAGTRLALLLPVRAADFRITPGHYAMLIAASFAAWLAGGIVRLGFPGTFDNGALAIGLAQIPILLVVCLLAATLLRDASLTLAFAVLFTASDPVFELAAIAVFYASQAETVAPYAVWINVLFIVWAFVVMLRAQVLASGWRMPRSLGAACLFGAMLVFLVFYMPRAELWRPTAEETQPVESGLLREDLFHLQGTLLETQLAALEPERPGIVDLYFVGAATYALQETFLKELAVVKDLVAERFDASRRSIALVNHVSTLDSAPIATASNLKATLDHLGRTINPEEDVVMLFLSTHGYKDARLAFEMPPLSLAQLNPTMLSRMLADSGIKWKIIVISACYSGSFVEPLRDDHSLIITASDALHTSFGCEYESDITWFGQAYFNEGFRSTRSFLPAFALAREAVSQRERAEGKEPSNPQLHLGGEMENKLEALERPLKP
jgi:hypothetical protein